MEVIRANHPYLPDTNNCTLTAAAKLKPTFNQHKIKSYAQIWLSGCRRHRFLHVVLWTWWSDNSGVPDQAMQDTRTHPPPLLPSPSPLPSLSPPQSMPHKLIRSLLQGPTDLQRSYTCIVPLSYFCRRLCSPFRNVKKWQLLPLLPCPLLWKMHSRRCQQSQFFSWSHFPLFQLETWWLVWRS